MDGIVVGIKLPSDVTVKCSKPFVKEIIPSVNPKSNSKKSP